MSSNRLLAVAAGSLFGLSLMSSGAQATPSTYRGSFSGPITYSNCSVPPASDKQVAGGTWRVNLHARKATARFVITVNGQPHVAYTAQMSRVGSGTATFEATLPTAAGPLVVTLTGSSFRYVIAPYDLSAYGGATCDAVEYDGTLTS